MQFWQKSIPIQWCSIQFRFRFQFHGTQVYIPKRRPWLIQVLHPANAYTKLFATCSCIFTYSFVCHLCIYAIRPACVHHGVRIGCPLAPIWHQIYHSGSNRTYFMNRFYFLNPEEVFFLVTRVIIYAWADNKRIWAEEVPVWMYTFWDCKPVCRYKSNTSLVPLNL